MNEQSRFSHKDAAEYLGIATQTLYNWRNKRRGPDYVLMGRKVIYLKTDLDHFIESKRINLN